MRSKEGFSLVSRATSFRYAFRGLLTVLVSQHNAWIHALATVIMLALGYALGLTRGEWCAVVLSMMAVWSAESLNTAFEFLCDVASPDFHPLVEKAKDVAAAAVLVSALGAVAIGAIVYGPHLLALVR